MTEELSGSPQIGNDRNDAGAKIKFTEAISALAEKKGSLPLFIVFAFFGLWFSAFIGGHNMFDLKTEMQFTFYQFYLCDFSAGFVSRVIVGAVTSLFLDKVSVEQMTAVAGAAVAVSLVLLAFFAGAVLKKSIKEKAFVPLLAALLMIFEPIIAQSNYMFLGTLDVYVLILFLLILASYGTPVFYFAAPVFSVLAMTVHYHYMFSYFPAVIALFVYDTFLSEKKSRRILSAAGMGFTAAAGTASFVYFVFFAKNLLRCTADEFYELMVSRFDVSPVVKRGLEKLMDGNVVFRDYFDYYIFGYNKNTFYYDSGANFIDFLRRDRISRTPGSLYIRYFVMVLPVLLAFVALWIYCASKQKGSRRLPYIAFALITLALFPELFISSDVPRWMSATLTCQFSLLFAVYLKGDKTVQNVLGGTGNERVSSFRRGCALLAAVYIGTMLIVGRELPMFL